MSNKIIFQQDSPDGTEEVIRLDKEGFHYKGQFIDDAGEAHRLMVEFLRQNTQPARHTKEIDETNATSPQGLQRRKTHRS